MWLSTLRRLGSTEYATLDTELRGPIKNASGSASRPVYTGTTWTTDASFRETDVAIERAHSEGILAVKMEAATLYTFGAVREDPVVCFAHVTNRMGQAEEDFEKGKAEGSRDELEVVGAATSAWQKET